MEDPSILFILLGLIILSGIFSGSESALLSLEETKLRAMKEKKVSGIRYLEKVKNDPKTLIITILVGNNLVNILIPVLATVWGTATFGDSSLGIITGVLTIILLIFGEIIPKNFALAHNEKFSLLVAPFIYFLSKLIFPAVWVFGKISDLVTPKGAEQSITEEEVLAMVSMGEEHGGITKEEKMRIGNLLDFSNTTVQEVMTPRTKIEGIEETETFDFAKTFFLKNSHTRIPVFKENLDNITDIITLRDVLEFSEEHSGEKLVKNLELKTPYFVPITKKISTLFQDFQKQHIHLAIVLDEHGGTAGLITMEDIFEEIFGDIHDETDREEKSLEQVNEKTWKIQPQMTVEEVFEETGIWISSDDNDSEKNISLLLLNKLERFPRKGESVCFEGATLIIEKMNERSVEQIRMVISQ